MYPRSFKVTSCHAKSPPLAVEYARRAASMCGACVELLLLAGSCSVRQPIADEVLRDLFVALRCASLEMIVVEHLAWRSMRLRVRAGKKKYSG